MNKWMRALSASVATMVMTTGLLVAPASAARKPDLIVTAITVPDEVSLGEAFSVAARVRNAGKGGAGKSTTRFYLSPDPKKSRDDLRLGRGVSSGRIRAGKTIRVSTRLTIPDAGEGPSHLVVCSDDTRALRESNERNNCRSAPIELQPAPSSVDLIDQAITSGEITEAVGLLYKVFLAFGDDRFPERFRGDDDVNEYSGLLIEAAGSFESLPEDVQLQLLPFFIPPFHAGSWYGSENAQPSRVRAAQVVPRKYRDLCDVYSEPGPLQAWDVMQTPEGNVNIWWEVAHPEREEKAIALAAEVDRVWPKLIEAFGEPLPDGGSATNPCQGINSNLDIALVSKSSERKWLGLAPAYPGETCSGLSAFMLVNADEADVGTVAHELAHAAQFRYGGSQSFCDPANYHWLMESTATWFEDYTDATPDVHSDDHEHSYAPSYLHLPWKPLNEWHEDGTIQYGSYVFHYFLTHSGSDAQTIRAMWEGTNSSSALGAVDAALAGRGGLEKVWRDFAVWNYNREPFDFYAQSDDMTTSVLDARLVTGNTDYERSVGLDGSSERQIEPMRNVLGYLSAGYHHVLIEPDVKELTFEPSGVTGGVKIDALLKIGGMWERRDWSSKTEVCRTIESENVDEIFLIVSNANKDPQSPKADVTMELTAKDSCGGLEGTLDFTKTRRQHSGELEDAEDWNGTLDVRFKRQDGAWVDDGSSVSLQGTGVSDYSMTFGGLSCVSHTESTFSIEHEEAPTLFFTDGEWSLRFMVEGTETSTTTFSGDCEGTETDSQTVFFVVHCNGGVVATDPVTGRMEVTFGPEPDYEHANDEVQESQNCSGVLSTAQEPTT